MASSVKANGLGHNIKDITTRPPLNGTIPVDTAESSSNNDKHSASTNGSGGHSDVAGVLRRNQACLACRRRKLKCDAIRPHCSTCVRSYRHLLRTAPSTNPVLACEYDDSNEKEHQQESAEAEDEEEAGRKKKRKTSTGRKKQRESGLDEERETLMKRVAALEQELATKSATVTGGPTTENDAIPPNPWAGFMGPQAASPGTFLDMLSSAANGQNGPTNLVQPLWTSGDRSESLAGFSPFMSSMPDPTGGSFGMANGNGNRMSPAPAMLSPGNVFNFSPAPSGPAATLQWSGPDVEMDGTQPACMNQRGDATWGVNSLQSALQEPGVPGRQGSGDQTAIEEINAQKAADFAASYMDDANGTAGLDPQLLLDLFWPGWPPNLPEPAVVQQLVETFFEVVPNMPRLVHRGRFFSRMQLPPTHSDFPHPSLLHAMCALASSWGFDPQVKDASTPPEGRETQPTQSVCLSQQQAAYAKEAIQEGLNTGNRLMDVVRAMIILTRVLIDDTRMLECWTYCGLVSRMILPLGLNVRSAELSLKSVMLPPAADALEREERRIVVWMSMYHDTISSAASGWGSSMALDELTVPFPASKMDFDSGRTDMDSNPQDVESLDLFIKHPVVDSFVLALKAAVLLYRVNKFARKWKNRRLRDSDDLDGMQRPEFRELANAIACLQMTFPPELQDVGKLDDRKRLDVDLISAHVIPHTAVICLYEMFADVTDPKDQPAKRIINAARSIIRVVQQVIAVVPNGAVNLAAVMHSSSSVALVTAARTCLSFYRHALNIGDTMGAEGYRADIETARMALAQYGRKFKIGFHHAQLIEYFLDRATNPSWEKLVAHYPDHPRPGALPLTKQTHLGIAILSALNIKRGYWKATPETHGTGPRNISGQVTIETQGSTPGSQTSNGSAPGLTTRTSDSTTSSAPTSTASDRPARFMNTTTAWNRADAPMTHNTDTAMDLTHFSALKFLDFGSGRPRQSPPSTPSIPSA